MEVVLPPSQMVFLSDQVSLGSNLWVRLSLTNRLQDLCADLTDVTLADEDASSILTDNANRAFQGNVAMQVTQPGGQLWNQAMQVTSPDDQLLNQFGRNQNIQIQMKYKSDFNKYRH